MSRFDESLMARALRAVGLRAPEPAPEAVSPDALAIQVAAALCRRFEGFYSLPYLCPAGVPTIGYGATHYEDGRPVRMTDPAMTRQQAEALLMHHLRTVYMPAVLRLCPGIADPYRLAAIIDFTFNLGAGNLQASTLRRRINAGQWDAVPDELRKWNKGGGRVLRGLVLRREAEVDTINRAGT